LLDRLIDEEPARSSEAATGEVAIARAVRASVVRDLEVLLSTRPRLVGAPWAVAEPSPTIVDFGLPPARGTNLATASGRQEFARAIEAAIRCFEPRLVEARVSIEPGPTPMEPLRMTVAARLAAGTGGEPEPFEASWAFGSGRFRAGEGGA
jgi:type VI secretion system protein ImpF